MKNYEVVPPAFLFEQIVKKNNELPQAGDNHLKQLQDYPTTAPLSLSSAIFEEVIEISRFKSLSHLKDYSVTPPEKCFRIIQQNIKFTDTALPTGRLIKMNSFLRVAAAAILIVAIGYYFFLKTDLTTNENTAKIEVAVPKHDSINFKQIDNSGKHDDLSATKVKTDHVNTHKKNLLKQALINATTTLSSKRLMDIDGTSYTFLNNDLLAGFASFNPDKLPQFLLRETKEPTLVTIDNFTAVKISPGMADILRKMYKVKKNGKPTRLASRQQKKLQQWKKTDIDYFDTDSTKNPLNPVDLGNFIFIK